MSVTSLKLLNLNVSLGLSINWDIFKFISKSFFFCEIVILLVFKFGIIIKNLIEKNAFDMAGLLL